MEALEDLVEAETEQSHQGREAPNAQGKPNGSAGVVTGLGITEEPEEHVDQAEVDQIAEEESNPSRNSTLEAPRQGSLQLVWPRDESKGHTVDVVFVCGLGGHAYHTWRSPKNSKFNWMGEALHKYVPQTRILTYKYNSESRRKGEIEIQAKDLLRCIKQMPQNLSPNLGRRLPVIFVCHSTGGLIVKKLLVEANKNEETSWTVQRCLGILFFACPHNGFHSTPEVLVAVSPRFSGNPPSLSRAKTIGGVFGDLQKKMEIGFDTDLLRNSEFLTTLDHDFKSLGAIEKGEISILSYYSTPQAACTTIGPLEIRFPAQSATLGTPGDIPIPVEKDHFFICKYDGAEDSLFTPLGPAFRRMVDRNPDRERAPGWGQRKLTRVVEPVPPDREIPLADRIDVSIVEFYTSRDVNSPPVGSVRPGEVHKMKLDQFLKYGPLECVRLSTEAQRGSADATSVMGLELAARRTGSNNSREFRWIHVPVLVESWVEEVLHKIGEETIDSTIAEDLVASEIWTKRRYRPSHKASHGRFMEPTCTGLLKNSTNGAERKKTGKLWEDGEAARQGSLVIYMPYLHWDTFNGHQKRRKCLEQVEQPTHRTPQDNRQIAASKESECLEHVLLKEYWNTERPIHSRRSLDGFYYPNLKDLDARDKDQVLYKHTRNAPTHTMPKMLMVDQMWMWLVGDHTVLTFFPPNQTNPPAGDLFTAADLYTSICAAINTPEKEERVGSALDMVSLILSQAINVLVSRTDHAELRITDCFREYIDNLTAGQTQSLEDFRNYLTKGYRGQEQGNTTAQEKERNLSSKVSDPLSIKEELDMVVNIKDTIEELGSIIRLFEVQEDIVRKAEDLFKEAQRAHLGGEKSAVGLEKIFLRLKEYEGAAVKLTEAANRTHDSLRDLLDLKQKEANVSEARSGNIQALAAKQQERTLLIFTVVTIVFLPLNFLTSLFGVNAREFTGQPGILSFKQIGLYTGTITAGIVTICFLIAFNSVFRITLFNVADLVLMILTTAWAYLIEYSGIRPGWLWSVKKVRKDWNLKGWVRRRRRVLKEERGYKLADRYVGV